MVCNYSCGWKSLLYRKFVTVSVHRNLRCFSHNKAYPCVTTHEPISYMNVNNECRMKKSSRFPWKKFWIFENQKDYRVLDLLRICFEKSVVTRQSSVRTQEAGFLNIVSPLIRFWRKLMGRMMRGLKNLRIL